MTAKLKIAKATFPKDFASRVMVFLLLGLSAYHLVLTGSTVLSYTLKYPIADQFRTTLRYLTVPFPLSIFELENGHRPILPGLIRYIELNWFAGSQVLQITTSWTAAGIVLLLLARQGLRDLNRSPLLAFAAICSVCTLLIWNANDRMFIHAYEAIQLFCITLALVISTLAAIRTDSSHGPMYWLIALLACVVATFTFGPGISTFAALFASAVLLRRSIRMLGLVAITAVICFAVYFLFLPGSEGVQNSSAGSSPGAVVFFTVARIGAVIVEIPRPYIADELTRMVPALAFSAFAVTLACVSIVRRWRRGEMFTGIEVVAVAFIIFGLATNALISANRTAYFFENPGQLFADRYLFWSCMTWLGLLLYGLSRATAFNRKMQFACAVGVAVFSLSAMPIAIALKGWSSEVYRLSEVGAVAARLGIKDDALMLAISDAGLETTYRAIDAMRGRRVSMFADGSELHIGAKVPIGPGDLSLPVQRRRVPVTSPQPRTVMFLSGELPAELAKKGDILWFADNDGTLIGYAAFTNSGGRKIRLGMPTLNGFQGYVLQSDFREGWLIGERRGITHAIASLKPPSDLVGGGK